jgi:hypothetical protein|nr:MAG TPA: hypothetical protein [Caudoviricetes sp.]
MKNKGNRTEKQVQEELLKKLQEQEEERLQLLMEADKNKEESFQFDFDGDVVLKSEIADLVLEQIDNPKEKYELYYNVVNRLLKKHLPKGKQFEKERNFIYEEKNVFLTRGHRKNDKGIRGADGRMAFTDDINELVNVITDWITSKGGMFELYSKLLELNKTKGYDK